MTKQESFDKVLREYVLAAEDQGTEIDLTNRNLAVDVIAFAMTNAATIAPPPVMMDLLNSLLVLTPPQLAERMRKEMEAVNA